MGEDISGRQADGDAEHCDAVMATVIPFFNNFEILPLKPTMEAGSELKSVLNLQLASDSSSVFHLPYVLSILSKDSLSPSPHLAKWSARIISLLHSKDPGARWAGLCIAHKSALLSKSFMVDSAASWLPIVVPMLSVRVYFMSASSFQLMQC